jgi:hypothetical protein
METGMMRSLSLVVAFALAVVPMAVQAGEKEDIIAAASIAFDPYRGTTSAMDGDWAKPIYSRATSQLIAQWEKGLSSDEVEDLNGFGWFCECQDYDEKRFKVRLTAAPVAGAGAGRAVVNAAVDLGFGQPHDARRLKLTLVKEAGRWLIDDVTSQSFPKGVKVELRKAIAEHKAAGRR